MKRPPPIAASSRRGLTLLELMVVLAVVAVLATLAVPSMGNAMQRTRLAAAAENLAADLGEARFEAARLGLPLHIESRTGPDWCWAVATTAGCGCGQPAPCQLKTVHGSDHAGIRMHDSVQARLDPAGTSNGVSSVTFESPAGDRLKVELGSMGRPSICNPGPGSSAGAAVGRYARC